MLKVMIVGQKWLAEQLCLYCMNHDIDVAAVAVPTTDDRLALIARRYHISVKIASSQLDANDVPDNVDLILCAHAHCYISTDARLKTRLGALGYHPSLLPLYKGKNAIQDALDNREIVTGGSLYWLDDGWDTGKIFTQKQCNIEYQDARQLWINQLAPLGLQLFKDALDNFNKINLNSLNYSLDNAVK